MIDDVRSDRRQLSKVTRSAGAAKIAQVLRHWHYPVRIASGSPNPHY